MTPRETKESVRLLLCEVCCYVDLPYYHTTTPHDYEYIRVRTR